MASSGAGGDKREVKIKEEKVEVPSPRRSRAASVEDVEARAQLQAVARQSAEAQQMTREQLEHFYMKQMELARQTQETFQDQYQNQVELHTKQNEMQEQLQEQYKTVSEQYRLLQEASVAMGLQNKKIEALEEKIGSQASSRWGWFAEKGGGQADVDMSGQGEMPPTPSAPVIATGANLPIPPLYRGTTTLDKRAFMDAYMVYERRVRALSSGTSARVYLMPLRLCIEQKTLVRICAYELCKAEEDVSDMEWKEYFLPARTTLRRDYSQLQADMKKLEMKTTYQDAESRLVTLLFDFHAILDQHAMEDFPSEEPKKALGERTSPVFVQIHGQD